MCLYPSENISIDGVPNFPKLVENVSLLISFLIRV